jgi:hypothetical protein
VASVAGPKQSKPKPMMGYIGVALIVVGLGYAAYKYVTEPPPKKQPAAKGKH